MSPQAKVLYRLPNWSQNLDTNPDGTIDPAHATDCGEEALAIAIWATRGVELSEGAIRAKLQLPPDRGNTTADELASFLRRNWFKPSVLWPPVASLQPSLKFQLDRKHTPIVLGYWLAQSMGHWIVANGYGDDHMFYLDPWDGEQKSMEWRTVRALWMQRYIDCGEPYRYQPLG